MPKKKVVNAERKSGLKWWVIALLIIFVLDLILLNYLVFSIKNPFADNIGESKSIYDVNNKILSLDERVDLIRANLQICTNDFACATIFRKNNYSCLAGNPVCKNNFCVCS